MIISANSLRMPKKFGFIILILFFSQSVYCQASPEGDYNKNLYKLRSYTWEGDENEQCEMLKNHVKSFNFKAEDLNFVLSMAATYNREDCVIALLASGADPKGKANPDNWDSALFAAVHGGAYETAKILLSNGSNISEKSEGKGFIFTRIGATPLETFKEKVVACENYHKILDTNERSRCVRFINTIKSKERINAMIQLLSPSIDAQNDENQKEQSSVYTESYFSQN